MRAADDRLTPADIAMIRELDARGLPVILVLTKVDWIKNPITGHQGVAKDLQAFVDWLNDPSTRRRASASASVPPGQSSRPRAIGTGRARGTASVTLSRRPSNSPPNATRTPFASPATQPPVEEGDARPIIAAASARPRARHPFRFLSRMLSRWRRSS